MDTGTGLQCVSVCVCSVSSELPTETHLFFKRTVGLNFRFGCKYAVVHNIVMEFVAGHFRADSQTRPYCFGCMCAVVCLRVYVCVFVNACVSMFHTAVCGGPTQTRAHVTPTH